MNQTTPELNRRSTLENTAENGTGAGHFLGFAVVIAFILVGAALRLVPHPFNFSPIAALGLFGGAYLGRKSWSVLIPLAALFLSDLVLGFHSTMSAVYGAFVLVTCLGLVLGPKPSALRIGGMAVLSSVLFFLITNFAVWAQGGMYAHTLSGLLESYTMAIPFFQNTLAGDLCFSAVLFGGYALLTKAAPQLQVAA